MKKDSQGPVVDEPDRDSMLKDLGNKVEKLQQTKAQWQERVL